MSTYHVGLTKVSDNTVTHDFLLAEGREGQPRVKLGSREKEAAGAGQRGVIPIQSLHHGSGQHIARDQMMYEFADGMFADEPGVLKARGTAEDYSTIATNEAFHFYSRGNYIRTFGGGPTYELIVAPTAVYHTNGAVAMSPLANSRFTGSAAPLGDFLYFGQETDDAWHTSNYAGQLFMGNGVFTNNAGFKASFLASQAEKMWAVDMYPGAAQTKLKWTDDAGSVTPVFSSDYTFSSGRLLARDLGIVGPHALIALHDPFSLRGRVVAIDTSGMFTDVLSELPLIQQFSPFLGGQVLWFMGRPRGVWFQGISSYTDMDFPALPRVRMRGGGVYTSGGLSTAGTPGMGIAAYGRELYLPIYGNFVKRDGTEIEGSVLLRASLERDGLFVHTIATPESVPTLEKAHVAGAFLRKTVGVGGDSILELATFNYVSNTALSDIHRHRIRLWDGISSPASFDTKTKFLRTSRYVGDDWTTKQGELLRGYITQLPANSSAVVRIYLDGASNETYNFSINTAGPFAQSLPANIIGRDVALDMETNANGSVVIEFPWSLDYFAVPDQKDIVRLPVLAGRDQVTPAGTLSDKTRAETLDALASICASKERWTLAWWDETPDWDVIPLGYEATEIEPEHVPGAGAAVAWITLQRL